jgi:hypothetical protein
LLSEKVAPNYGFLLYLGVAPTLHLTRSNDANLTVPLGAQVDGNPQRIGLFLKQVERPVKARPGSATNIYRREKCQVFGACSDINPAAAQECIDQEGIYVLEDEQYDHVLVIDKSI